MGFQGTFEGKDSGTNTKLRIRLNADLGDVVGGDGAGGDLSIPDGANVVKIRLDGGGAEVPPPFPQTVPAVETIILSGATGTITAGRAGVDGAVSIKGETGGDRVTLSGSGYTSIGVNGAKGYLGVRSADGGPTLELDGSTGNIALGGGGTFGKVVLRDKDGKLIGLLGGLSANLCAYFPRRAVLAVATRAGSGKGVWCHGSHLAQGGANEGLGLLVARSGEVLLRAGPREPLVRSPSRSVGHLRRGQQDGGRASGQRSSARRGERAGPDTRRRVGHE